MTPLLRPATDSDFDAVLDIVSHQYMRDYDVAYEAERLRAVWDRIHLERDALVVADGGDILAYATIEREEADAYIYLYNQPETSAVDVTRLLRAAEESTNATTFITRMSDRNALQLAAAEQSGYRIYLSFLSMEHTIQREPYATTPPDGVSIRTFTIGEDEQAVYEVDEAASLDKGYSSPMTFEQWAKRMRLGQADFDPDLWFLACHDDRVVGVALNYIHEDVAWVDHLSVLRSWRRQGVGRVLLQHSLDAFRVHGVSAARLNVDSGSLTNARRLYANIGFQTVQTYHWLKKEQTVTRSRIG